MELGAYLRPLKRWWWLLLASILLAAASSSLYSGLQPPLYEARTTLMIGRAFEDPNPTGNELALSEQLAGTYADLVQRRPVRVQTMAALGLDSLPVYVACQVPNRPLLEIAVVDTDPQRAKAVADELANLGLLLTSTALAILLCEVTLRLIGLGPLYVSPERDRFWQYDSLLGWAHRPGQEGVFETPQFRVSVRINGQGLRNREHSYEPPADTGRYLVLGDSFAWGYGVEEAERFTQRLEASLGVEVVNAGVSGYSTDQELLWYRSEGVKYGADLVIMVLAGNDIGDNSRSLVHNIYYKPRFVRQDGALVLAGYPVPRTSPQGRSAYFLSQRSALAYFLAQRYFDLRAALRDPGSDAARAGNPASGKDSAGESFELTMALLEEMRATAEAQEAAFMIVATDRWWNGSPETTFRDLIDALRADGFWVLDVESMAGFDPEAMLIPDDGHWNPAGHEFVAQKIADLLDRAGPAGLTEGR